MNRDELQRRSPNNRASRRTPFAAASVPDSEGTKFGIGSRVVGPFARDDARVVLRTSFSAWSRLDRAGPVLEQLKLISYCECGTTRHRKRWSISEIAIHFQNRVIQFVYLENLRRIRL